VPNPKDVDRVARDLVRNLVRRDQHATNLARADPLDRGPRRG